MQKNLGPRVEYAIPETAKEGLGLMRRLAGSTEMPGQANTQYLMDLQSQRALANARSASNNPYDVMATAANLGESMQGAQLQLGGQAAQNYMQRQQGLYGALNTMSGYQDKVTADRQNQYDIDAEAAA